MFETTKLRLSKLQHSVFTKIQEDSCSFDKQMIQTELRAKSLKAILRNINYGISARSIFGEVIKNHLEQEGIFGNKLEFPVIREAYNERMFTYDFFVLYAQETEKFLSSAQKELLIDYYKTIECINREFSTFPLPQNMLFRLQEIKDTWQDFKEYILFDDDDTIHDIVEVFESLIKINNFSFHRGVKNAIPPSMLLGYTFIIFKNPFENYDDKDIMEII